MRDWKGHVPSLEELGSLRRHQQETYQRALDVVERKVDDKVTVLQVTPGGGKSLAASIFAHVLIRSGYVDRVVIVVPRDSLRTQMRDGFCEPDRGLHLHVGASASDVSQRFIFSSAGYVTTYQAVAQSAGERHIKATHALRTLVILDEVHHLVDEEGRGWVPGVRALVSAATHVLAMSGGLGRDDAKPVPFIPYLENRSPVKHVIYSRSDALEERAIIPIRVDMLDGDTEYFHKGRDHEVTLSEAAPDQEKAARRTALKLDAYREELLGRALSAWDGYVGGYSGYRSQLIVICDSQADAQNAARRIREIHPKYEIALAISEEGSKAVRALRRFRDVAADILVTCQMAYEGLDAPFATHMAYMSRIRSVPWMDQAFARVTRFNSRCGLTWEKQKAYIFAPCDPSMKAYVAQLQKEQDDRYRDRPERVGGQPFARRSDFAAVDATPTDIVVGGEHGIPPPEVQLTMRLLRDRNPCLQAVDARELEGLARMFIEAKGDGPRVAE